MFGRLSELCARRSAMQQNICN